MTRFVASLLMLAALATTQGQAVNVTGSFDYKSYLVPKYFQASPTIALLCISRSLVGSDATYVPKSGQILGRLTTPVTPAPLSFTVSLPVEPGGEYVDLDVDGQQDKGVQVFAAVLATNIFSDSYLEQIEQSSGFWSFLTDPVTNSVRKGALLVYAPDDAQHVPVGAGKDGTFFTADDVVQSIPKGYCVLELSEDGGIVVRFETLEMDILEPVGIETPDFSRQGFLSSFDSLVAHLKERYAYTQRRRLDWDEVSKRFRPRAVEAEAAKDKEGFFELLNDLAHEVQDGHVQVLAPYALKGKYFARLANLWSGDLGATVAKLSDGRIVVTAVAEGTPAHEGGITPGTEIVGVNGKSVADHIRSIPQIGSHGTRARVEAEALNHTLAFAAGTQVELTLRNPGGTDTTKVRLTARDCVPPSSPSFPDSHGQPFSTTYLEDGKIGYAWWSDFGDIGLNIAAWERFLASMVGRPQMIIDLRGNGGGLQTLYLAMASYLFTANSPAQYPWLDSVEFDDRSKAFERLPLPASPGLWSHRPDLAYGGKVVVLVDGKTASSAEFFAKYLQFTGRAIVIAEEGTDGAGGSVREVLMPEQIVFMFTGGRMLSLGSDEPVLEGKGVTPDVLVPITVESEQRKRKGEDVVLSFACDWLKRSK